MVTLWLDANVLIEAKNAFYAFDIAPGFWSCIREASKSGLVRSPTMVFDEIAKGGDDLSLWAKEARAVDLFLDPDKDAQALIAAIGSHVQNNYEDAKAQKFLSGADPWVIATASACKGTVVTQEKFLAGPDVKKIKIPNICKFFGIPCINVYELLRMLEVKLVAGK
jgi:Domain of unknown function (DUF4411)